LIISRDLSSSPPRRLSFSIVRVWLATADAAAGVFSPFPSLDRFLYQLLQSHTLLARLNGLKRRMNNSSFSLHIDLLTPTNRLRLYSCRCRSHGVTSHSRLEFLEARVHLLDRQATSPSEVTLPMTVAQCKAHLSTIEERQLSFLLGCPPWA